MGKRSKTGKGVWLEGGPMDGWFVTLDAAALTREWGIEHGGYYEVRGADPSVAPIGVWVAVT